MIPPPLELDVRPLLATGRPPLVTILDAVHRLAPGQALRLLAPFEPTPLYALLREQGLEPTATAQPDGTWEIVFRPPGSSAG